ncbi:MAG: VOC family protein [Deltaproteobacteria bacterium]
MKNRNWLSALVIAAAIILSGAAAAHWLAPRRLRAQEQNSPARPPITGVAFIMLRVSSLDAAREYYGHVLGLSESDSGKNVEASSADSGNMTDETLFLKPRVHYRFYANTHQFVEIVPGLSGPDEDRLIGIGFETANAKELSTYLQSHGVPTLGALPPPVKGFGVKDPEGRLVAFVEYDSDSGAAGAIAAGKDKIISHRMIHVGFLVKDQMLEDRFYRDILNFKEVWHGGMTDKRADWVDMRVPDGADWLEYMLNVNNPTPQTRGVMNHLALGVPSVANAYKEVLARGYKAGEPKIGRDGKWQLNLYDPDLTRAEFMEPKPVETPCCSTFVTH